MSNIIQLKKGLNIPLSGEAALKVKKVVSPDIVAVCPTDFSAALKLQEHLPGNRRF